MERRIIIGDIHGCFQEFQWLLEKLRLDPSADRLILLGDLIDRGPSSWEVYREARKLSEQMGERFVYVRGNHEALLLKDRLSFKENLLWLLGGKGAAVRSFRQHGDHLLDSRSWIAEHSVLYYEDTLFQCAHAGVRTDDIQDNDEYTLLEDRSTTRKNRYTGKLTITGHSQLRQPMFFSGQGGAGKALPYGSWQELPKAGLICIDTGCALGNRLTACVICRDRFYLDFVSADSSREKE